jgi:hypothetical protein
VTSGGSTVIVTSTLVPCRPVFLSTTQRPYLHCLICPNITWAKHADKISRTANSGAALTYNGPTFMRPTFPLAVVTSRTKSWAAYGLFAGYMGSNSILRPRLLLRGIVLRRNPLSSSSYPRDRAIPHLLRPKRPCRQFE